MNKLTKFAYKNLFQSTTSYYNINFYKKSLSFFSDTLKKKERLEEENYVNKQERELMKKMLKKIKAEHNPEHESDEINELKSILRKNKIEPTENLIKDIREWRDEHH